MAEINRVSSFSDSSDVPKKALVDSQRRVVVTGVLSGNDPITSITYGSQTGVSDNTVTTIATLIANGVDRLVQVSCSGTGYAKFLLYINSVLKDVRRTGPSRNALFDFNNPIKLNASDIVDIKVIHFNVGVSENFEATIYGFSA